MLAFIKSAAKNSLFMALGNVSTKVIGFILLPMYTSHLSVQEYGILGLLEVSSQLFVSIFGLSLSYSFYRFYWDKEYIDMRRTINVHLFIVAAVRRYTIGGISDNFCVRPINNTIWFT